MEFTKSPYYDKKLLGKALYNRVRNSFQYLRIKRMLNLTFFLFYGIIVVEGGLMIKKSELTKE